MRLFYLFITGILFLSSYAHAQLRGFSVDSMSVKYKMNVGGVDRFGLFNRFNTQNELTNYGIADSSVSLNKLSTAAHDFIGSGGSVTNNPDDVSLETVNSNLAVKQTFFNTAFLDYYTSISDAVSSIGSSKYILYINKPTVVSGSLTIPSNITLKITPLASIDGDGGNNDTLKVNGYIENLPVKWIGDQLSVTIDSLTLGAKFHFENFGATGTGDATAAIQKAISSVGGKARLLGVSGRTYTISSELTGGSVNINSTGEQKFTIAPGAHQAFNLAPGQTLIDTLQGVYVPGNDTLEIDDTAGIGVGDEIELRSDEDFPFDPSGNNKSEKVHVYKVLSDSTLVVYPALVNEYDATETVQTRTVSRITASIKNFDIVYPDNTTVTAVGITGAYLDIARVKVVHAERQGFIFKACIGGYVRDNEVFYADEDGNGYGYYFEGTSYIRFVGNDAVGCRSGIDGGGWTSRYNIISENRFFGVKSLNFRGIGTHEGSEHWVIKYNLIVGATTAFLDRGMFVSVIGNQFVNCDVGISFNGGSSGYVQGNRLYSSKAYRDVSDDFDGSLASSFASITSNADNTDDAKYIFLSNYADVKNAFLDISLDTLRGLTVEGNVINFDYSATGHNPNLLLGSGTRLENSRIGSNTTHYPDSLNFQLINQGMSIDSATVTFPGIVGMDQHLQQSKLFFDDRYRVHHDANDSSFVIANKVGKRLFQIDYSDSLDLEGFQNPTLESNLTYWDVKAGSISHETGSPLVGTGSIRVTSDPGSAGAIADTSKNIDTLQYYEVAGVVKRVSGASSADIELHGITEGLTGQTFIATLLKGVPLGVKKTFKKLILTLDNPNLKHVTFRSSDAGNVCDFDSLSIRQQLHYDEVTQVTGLKVNDDGARVAKIVQIGSRMAFISGADTFYTSAKNDTLTGF